jgi:DNA-binding CsgD family transcriptional regulator/tetratricopeptide (TPR) repeat protein
LPDQTRRLVQLAAADPSGDRPLVWRAAERLGIPVQAGAPAVEAGLAEFSGSRVRFRHPLARSAAYRSASLADRQQMHAALAEATDPVADPDRRAWHRAQATPDLDEDVAAELEDSAGRAQARGGLAAAAAFLERSMLLTADRARHAQRALAAARAHTKAGAFGKALELLTAAEAGPPEGFQRAQVSLLRGHIAFASGLGSDAPARLLLQAAKQLEPFDLDIARETYLAAWGAATNAGTLAGEVTLLEICRSALALPPSTGAPRPLDLLLDGFALLVTEGRAAAAPALQRASKALISLPVEDVLRWGWMTPGASLAVWDFEGLHATCVRQVQLVREAGVLSELPIHLSSLGIASAWTGDFAAANSVITEAENISAATGNRLAPFAALRLISMQGREAEASALLESAIELAAATGQEQAATSAHWGAAVLYNGLARYGEAAAAARQATSNPLDPWISLFALPELIEAASRIRDTELARAALARLTAAMPPDGNDFALGMEARCRALVSPGPDADGLYREAIDRLSRTRLRPELARTHLLYGEWLRRRGRRRDAREQLHAAHDMLTAMGMEAFAERGRQELTATGETVRTSSVGAITTLTSQEAYIARLARDGLTNAEIAARLFLSERTISWHLRRIFTKLDIGSRRELNAALAQLRHGGEPS